jgi:hypothetical protein
MPPRRAATAADKPLSAAAMGGDVKLPPFEADMPDVWFNQAEAYFEMKGVIDRRYWFFHTLWALSPPQKKLVRDISSQHPPPADAYVQLKERLMQLYDQGERDRFIKFLSMPPMGGLRPTELLAEMRQLYPLGEDNTRAFRYHFFLKLPTEIRRQLGEDDSSSVTALAARADKLWSRETQAAATVAAVDEEEVMVVDSKQPPPKKKKEAKRSGRKRQYSRTADGDGNQDPWTKVGLCRGHFLYGDKSWNCRPGCSRAGN